MHGRVRALALDGSEDGAGLGLDDRERVGARRAQADLGGGEVAAPVDVAGVRALQVGEQRGAFERLRAERRRVGVVERRLERRRADVAVEDPRVRVVEDRRLDPAAHAASRGSRMKNWSSASAEAISTASPWERRPARPHCWRRLATVPGKPTETAQSSRPTSMPSSSASVAVTPSSSPSTSRRSISRRCSGVYPGAVRGEPRRSRRVEPLAREAVDELGRAPALREADRPLAVRDERGEHARRLAERAGAQAELLVEDGRVPEGDGALGPRRRVLVDHGHVEPGERGRLLAGVRDRRRGEEELRLRAVDRGRAAQAAQDVAHVRAEDAAVDVRLVHDDVAEVREDVAPAVVMRQDADVEHVRVREDDVRPLADLPAGLRRGVAVVDRRPHLGHAERGERAGLVLGERLRRVQVERAILRLRRERVQHRQVERERLAARRPGRDHHVLAALRGRERFRLVRVERREPAPLERLHDLRVEFVRQRDDPGILRR